jgi:Capsular polysaccharide biosynthesis protein
VPDELDLLDYVAIIRRRLWLIILLMLIGGFAAFSYGHFMQTPVYEASAKLIMTRTGEGDLAAPPDSKVIEGNILLMETFKEVIRTPLVLHKALSKYPEIGTDAAQLGSQLKVSSGLNSQVLTVQVRADSYLKAAQLTNAVSEAFVEEAARIYHARNIEILYTADASAPSKALNMSMNKMIVFALVLAAIAGCGLSLLLEYLDRTLRQERDIARVLGLPTIAELPLLMKNHSRGRANRKLKIVGENPHVPVEK